MTEGPYKLPEGWRWVRLGEVVNASFSGGTPSTKVQKYWDGDIPWTTSAPIAEEDGLLKTHLCTITQEGLENSASKIAPSGSLILATRVGVGKAVVATFDVAISQDLTALVLCEDVNPVFLAYTFKSGTVQAQLRTRTRGTTIKGIPRKELLTALIPLPPLEEQRRIVARIEELMERVREAKRLRRQAKEDAERLWQSALAETFPRPGTEPPPGWRWMRLGEVCEVWDTLRKPVKKKDRIPGNVPYCGANGVIDCVDGHTHAGEFVLLAEDGGFYGPGEPTAYIMSGRFWANNHVHILRGRPDHLVNQFLYYCLVAYDLRPFLTGATRPKLTQGAMRSIPIPLPPLEEQRQIVAHLEAVQEKAKALKDAQATIDAELQRLEQAILDRAFRGEL